MAHIRELPSGAWQATVRLPSGQRRSRAFPVRADAYRWADEIDQDVAHQHAAAADPEAVVTWTVEGLNIHIPVDLLTIELAQKIEQAVRGILAEAAG